MKSKLILLSICLISTILCGIMPDAQNPVLLTRPHTAQTTSIDFKFTLEDGYTVDWGQLFGVRFPSGISSLDTPPVSGCSLHDDLGNMWGLTSLAAEANAQNSKETSTHYCRFENPDVLSLGSGRVWTLRLTLNVAINSNWFNRFVVFVATSRSTDQVLLAQATFGNAGQYGDYTTFAAPLKIESASIEATSGPCSTSTSCSTVYPNNTFNLRVKLVADSFLYTLNDAVVVFEWTNIVNANSLTVVSNAYNANSNDQKQAALVANGQLKLQSWGGSSNMYALTGVGENLVKNRKFELVVSGFSARNQVTGSSGSLTAYVYWINTNSIISYSTVNNVFTVATSSITFTQASGTAWSGIAHPEFFDIYESGSWPMRFIFQVEPVPNGGFLHIAHQETANRVWSFIPSTCDFSDAVNSPHISNELGKRPQCFNANGNSSELIFRVPALSARSTISVVVWGVAVKCSTNDVGSRLNANSEIVDLGGSSSSDNSRQFQFKYTMFTDINQGVFSGSVAESAVITMYGTCHGNVRQHDNLDLADVYGDTQFVSGSKDALIYAEFYDWQLIDEQGTTLNVTTSIATKFYYSSDQNTRINTSNNLQFGIRIETEITDTSDHVFSHIPMPISGTSAYKTTLTLQFSRLWVTSGVASSADCSLNFIDNKDMALDDDGDNRVSVTGNTIVTSSSNLYQTGGNYNSADVMATPLRIVTSTLNDSGTPQIASNPYTPGSGSISEYEALYFSTDCYKPVVPSVAIRSIYTYIDFTYMFKRTDAINAVTRVGRFVKLWSEGNVIRNPTDNVNVASTSISLHYLNAVSATNKGVCIVELGKAFLDLASDRNALVVNLINLQVLEPDFLDLASRYPAAPILESSIYVYGSSVTYPFSPNEAEKGFLNAAYTLAGDGTRTNDQNSSYIRNTLNMSSSSNSASSKAGVFNSYWIKLSSRIIFSGISATNQISATTTNANQVLVPIICPVTNSAGDGEDRTTPYSVSGDLLDFNGNNYSDVSNLESILFTSGSTVYASVLEVQNNFDSVATPWSTAKVRFNQFSASTNQNRLYIANETGSAFECDAFSLFLRSDIAVDQTSANRTFTLATVQAVSNPTNAANFSFSYNGRSFNKAFLASASTTQDVPVYAAASLSSVYYDGIIRPSVSSLNTSGFTNNAAAFHCVENGGDNTGLSNWSGTDFVLTFFNEASSTNWEVTISLDVSAQTVYTGDIAMGLNYAFKFPTPVGSGTSLTFTSDSLNSNSLCAIRNVDNSKASLNCNAVSSTQVTCPLSAYGNIDAAGSVLNICCYNTVSRSTNPSVTQASLSAQSITIASISTSLTSTLVTQNSNSAAVTAVSPKITAINFTQVNQLGGLANAFITVTLGRQAVRNMVVRITGALSDLYIGSTKPNCYYTYADTTNYSSLMFGSDTDSGDFLVNNCRVAPTATGATHTIELWNRNVIYKCGISLATQLILSLQPVKVRDLSSASSNTYTVTLGLGTADTYISNNPSTATDVFPATTLDSGVWTLPSASSDNALCNLVSISPRIVGMNADYQFEFDLNNFPSVNAGANTNKVPNEVTIAFEPRFYGGMTMVRCRYQNEAVPCDWNMNFLNIRFDNALATNAKHVVTVMGIRNNVLSNNNPSFQCSVNWYNTVNSRRENLIVGSGTSTISTFNPTTRGNLLFLSAGVNAPGSLVPNAVSATYDVSFTVDTSLGLVTLPQDFTPASVDTNPVLLVEFPHDFWLHGSNLSVTLERSVAETDQQIIDANPTKRMTKLGTPPTISSFQVVGNRVRILFASAVTVDSSTYYFTLKFANIPNPWNATGNRSAGPLRLTMMNDSVNPTKVFTSYNNLNNQHYDAIDSLAVKAINYFRGYKYTYSNAAKSVISFNGNNMMTVNPGRYRMGTVALSSASNVGNPGSTTITLSSTVFGLFENSVDVNTGTRRSVNFHLGTKCSTIPGPRYVRFTSSNNSEFYNLSPVHVNVLPVASSYGNLWLTNSAAGSSATTFSSAPGGSLLLYIRASEPGYEKTTFTFTSATGASNSSSSSIVNSSSVEIAAMASRTDFTFQNTDANTTEQQKYNVKSNNNCFRFGGVDNSDFAINMDLTLTDVSGVDLTAQFTYVETTEAPFNTLHYTYRTTVNTVLYCALVCQEANLPTDANIARKNQPENTPNVQYLWHLFERGDETYELTWSNLYRGKAYKMKCVLTNTAANNPQSVSSNVWNNQTVTSLAPPNGLQYTFSTAQTSQVYALIQRYAQLELSQNGFEQDGSVVVVDSVGNNLVGYSLTQQQPCTLNLAVSNNNANNTNTTTNNGTTANGTAANGTSANSARLLQNNTNVTIYSIVANQDPLATQRVNLVERVTVIKDKTADAQSLSTFIGGATVQGSVSAVTVSDDALVATNLVVTGASYDSPNFSISLYWNQTRSVRCYWKVTNQTQSNPLSAAVIMNCPATNSTSINCANFILTNNQTTFTSNVGDLSPGTYVVWGFCMNNIPGAQMMTNPRTLATVTIDEQNHTPTNNTTDPGDNGTTVCVPGTQLPGCPDASAKILNLSILILLISWIFLFDF